MRPKKKRKEFNDLLIPIIFLLSIHPFITRLIVYESGLAKYKWFPDNDIVSDFFSYYKSYGLILVAVFAAIILLIYLLLYRSRMKNMKLFIPLGIYSLLIILSAAFSVDVHTSLVGGMAHFESVFVLLGYGVLAIYTYQIMKSEEDFKSVLKSMIISSVVMIILGFLQMLGKDIIEFTWFQKLIIPRDYWEEYLGNIKNLLSTNAVSLTLFNPNYASVYVAMLIPVFMVRMLSVDDKKKKVSYIILLCAMLTVQFKTYSRTGFLSILITILFMGYFYRDRLKQWKKQCAAGFILCFVLFIAVDSLSGFRFTTKLNDTFKNVNKTEGNSLEEILTNKEQVSISYKGVKLQIAIDSSQGSLAFTDVSGEDKTGLYNKNTNSLELVPFQDIKFMIKKDNGKELLIARINGTDWNFYNDKEQGYVYLNDFGKTEKLEKIDTFGFKNQEYIASGRGYIWSRSIPLLKKNPLTGTGPDTFLLVFPQWDHVGKANNCKTPYTLIEKPHNMYLMIGIQTGVISLLLFLLFYILYFIQSFRIYRKITGNGYIKQLGLGCFLATISYMVSGLFNDSSVQTSPTFWILIGMGSAANYQLRQGSKSGVK